MRTRRGEQRGASVVELALIVTALSLLLFGIIDFGFVYNDYVSVRQGARDGARVMAVDSAPTPPGQAPGQLYDCGALQGAPA